MGWRWRGRGHICIQGKNWMDCVYLINLNFQLHSAAHNKYFIFRYAFNVRQTCLCWHLWKRFCSWNHNVLSGLFSGRYSSAKDATVHHLFSVLVLLSAEKLMTQMSLANRFFIYRPSLLFLWLQENVARLLRKLTFSQFTEPIVEATTQDILVVLQ